jgi:GMP synthase-like glutamine amidotransferase
VDAAERIDAVLQWHRQLLSGIPFPVSLPPCYRSEIAAAPPEISPKPEVFMRVLVIQNFANTGLGQVGTALAEADASVELLRADLGNALPDGPQGYDGLVVLGGGQNALADEESPWLPGLCGLMRDFADSGRSVLGICLGSQLLARAYDGQNIIGGASEFGWHEVELTPEGIEDPVLAGLAASFRSFQWHDDTFILPRGASRLAGSLAVHNQAFRVGRAAYGFQFHFEADRPMVEHWSGVFADWLAEKQPDWNLRRPHDAARFADEADAAGLVIARNWVRTIATPSAGC